TNCLFSIWGSGPNVVAVGCSGTIRYTPNGGAQWIGGSNNTSALYSVFAADINDLYVAGTEPSDGSNTATVQYSASLGASWSRVGPLMPYVLNCGWAASATEIFVGGSALLLHSTDGGSTYVNDPIASATQVDSVWGTANDNVYAIGSQGEIF